MLDSGGRFRRGATIQAVMTGLHPDVVKRYTELFAMECVTPEGHPEFPNFEVVTE